MITVPISEFIKLHEESVFYVVAGVGAFVMSKVGSMLLKCLVTRRRQKRKDDKFKQEVKEITEKSIKDGFVNTNPHARESSLNSGNVLEV